jgi:hypothetical protein
MRTILSSVGLRGVNRRDDVRTIQELLNLVPHADGGPMIKLATDGISGRKTNGAIEKLQAHNWGWGRVTTRVDRDSATWKLLLSYDKQAAAPSPVPVPKPPEPQKVLGTQFIVMMAAKPGQLIDVHGANFYFQVIDQSDQTQQAWYSFGNVNAPPPVPTPWSVTIPPIVTTPLPIGAADWAGTAIFYEKSQSGGISTEIWLSPDVLKGKTIRFGLHAHLDEPTQSSSRTSSQFSAPFRLRDVTQGVKI